MPTLPLDFEGSLEELRGRSGPADTGLGTGFNRKVNQTTLSGSDMTALTTGLGRKGGKVKVKRISARGRR